MHNRAFLMKTNKDLRGFYQKVYLKGEKKHFTHFVTKGTTSSEAKEIIKEISWKSKSVLDVGCGTGNFAHLAAKNGASRVLGIDYAPEAIVIAKNIHKHPNLKFDALNVRQIKEKFDVIVSIGTLEHMDEPYKILKKFKSQLNPHGKIIVTTPNWTNPRGYVLMTLLHLFNAPITLADLHYFTPTSHLKMAKKLGMKLKWRTIEKDWAHGALLIDDFKRRIPNVLRDAKLPKNAKRIKSLIKWIEENVVPLNNSQPHSGATGLYVYSR